MKVTRPSPRPDPGTYHKPRARPRSAQEAAIERKLSQYIHLECDHYITWDMDELYRSFGSPKDKHYCDECGKWRKVMAKPKPVPTPSEPLF